MRDTVLHLRKLLPRSDTQQCRHRRLGVGLGHDGGAAVTDGDGHRDADLDGLALRERHGQIDVLGVGDDEAGAGLVVAGDGVGLDRPLVDGAETANRVLRQARGPQDVRGGEDGVEQSGAEAAVTTTGDRGRGGAGGDQLVRGGLLEAVEQLTDGSSTRVMPATATVPGMMHTCRRCSAGRGPATANPNATSVGRHRRRRERS